MFLQVYLCSLRSEVLPELLQSVRNGTPINALRIRTRSYPSLNFLHKLFYKKYKNSYIKFVSEELINYLTPRFAACLLVLNFSFLHLLALRPSRLLLLRNKKNEK